MLVLQKFLIIINEAIGYFEVAGWVNVLSQNGQFRGSDHLLLGYAKMIGQDPPTPPPIKIIKRFHIAILYNTQPRPQGFSFKKMGGAGKGPAIGWSRVQPKYSEKLIYMQPAGFALTEGSNNRPTHFSREKPWGRGWYNTVDSDYGHTALDEFSTC